MRLPRKRPPADYATTTYDSPHFLVRHGHRRRFDAAIEVVDRLRPTTMLDYGAGDGAVLRQLAGSGRHRPERTVAYDPEEAMARSIREAAPGLPFPVEVVTEFAALQGRTFDLVVCLEVLEHMPLPERVKFYRLCAEQLAPGGRCLIDVPVEVGPTLLVKHLGRVWLKGRPSEYRPLELAGIAAGRTVLDPQRFDPGTGSTWIQDHKGFDYRVFRRELESYFTIEQVFATPVRVLPPWLGNQEIFFLVRNRPAARTA